MMNKIVVFLCLFALSVSQLNTIAHKTVELGSNHLSNNGITFRFTPSAEVKALYYGHTFQVTFPSDAVPTTNGGCSYSNGGTAVVLTATRTESTIKCTYNGEGVVTFIGTQHLTITGITLLTNFVEYTGLALWSSVEANAMLLASSHTFRNIAVYNNYESQTESDAWVKLLSAKAENTSRGQDVSLAVDAASILPFSNFNLKVEAEVQQYVRTNEVVIYFNLGLGGSATVKSPTIVSSAYVDTSAATDAPANPMYASLPSVESGLKLEQIGDSSMWVISGIRGNLIVGRKFTLTISGFNASTSNNATSLFNNLELSAMWLNTHSVVSFHRLTPTEKVKANKFFVGGSFTETLTTSAYLADNFDVFESGTAQVFFKVRVPTFNSAGTFTVSLPNNETNSYSFVAATCDFSVDTSAKLALGQRKLCSGGDNSIHFSLDSTTGTFTDVMFSVWVVITRCASGDAPNLFSSANSVSPSAKLNFTYDYVNIIKTIVDEVEQTTLRTVSNQSTATEINCVRPSSKDSDIYLNTTSAQVSSRVRNSALSIAPADSLLYHEFNNFSTFTYTGTTGVDAGVSTLENGSPVTSTHFYASTTAKSVNSLFLASSNLLLPYAQETVNDGVKDTYSPKLAANRLEVSFSRNYHETLASSTALSTCYFRFVTDARKNTYSKLAGANGVASTGFTLSNGSQSQDFTEADSKLITARGLATDCIQFKAHSNFKNFYTAVEVQIRFYRSSQLGASPNVNDPRYERLTRVNRLIKFYAGINGFLNTNTSNGSRVGTVDFTNYSAPIFHSVEGGNSSLCILEINAGNINQIAGTSFNTIMLTLSGAMLPQSGNGMEEYPTSASAGVKTYPVYNARGHRFDISDHKELFGSVLIFTGLNSNGSVTTQDANLFIPLLCNSDFNLVFNAVNYASNVYTSYNNNTDDLDSISLNTIEDKTYSFRLKFEKSTLDNNNLISHNFQDINRKLVRSVLILSNMTESTATGTKFFENAGFVTSSRKNSSLGGIAYVNLHFIVSNVSNIDLSQVTSKIQRPTATAFAAMNKLVSVFGVGSIIQEEGEEHYQISNTNLITMDAVDKVDSVLSNFSVGLSHQNGNTNYVNDNGANLQVTVSVTSSVTGEGNLVLHSTALNLHSLCVITNTPSTKLSINITNSTISYGVALSAGNNSWVFSCYNLLTSDKTQVTFSTTSSVSIGGTDVYNASTVNLAAAISLPASAVEDAQLTNFELNSKVLASVTKVEFSQTKSLNGLSYAYITLDLGRSWRMGSSVTLTSEHLKQLKIDGYHPKCHFNLVNATPDMYNFYEFEDLHFPSTCDVSADAGSLTANTYKYVPKANAAFSRFAVFRVGPVLVKNLGPVTDGQNGVYTLNINLDTTRVIGTPLNASTFPVTANPTGFASVTSGLAENFCNLSSIAPRVWNTAGVVTWEFDLTGSADKLKVTNGETGTRVYNEFSIFMNPATYTIVPLIRCYFSSKMVPCEWSLDNFINIRLPSGLSDGKHLVSVEGIRNPMITSTMNSGNFLCSVNHFNDDARETLLVGTGVVGESNYTSNPDQVNRGNIIFYTSPEAMASNASPRDTTKLRLRFTPDFTQKLRTVEQEFVADTTTNVDNRPVVLVLLPTQYNQISAVTATLSYTSYNTNAEDEAVKNNTTGDVVYKAAVNVVVKSVEVLSRKYISLTLDSAKLSLPADLAFLDLELSGIDTPASEVNASDVRIRIMNDKAGSKVWTSTLNLNNSRQGMIAFNNYYQGPNYSFASSLAVVNAGLVKLSPGRYGPVTFTTVGRFLRKTNTLSLVAGQGFSALESSVDLSTGLLNESSINLGVPCKSTYGYYWVNFALGSAEGFARLTPVTVWVGRRTTQAMRLYSSNVSGNADASTFTLANGGFNTLNLWLESAPVEAVNITLSTATGVTNVASFKLNSGTGSQNVAAGKRMASFTYEIAEKPEGAQRVTLTSTNRCYGFSTTSLVRDITFNISDSLADLSKTTLEERFRYVANTKQNCLSVRFTPVAQTTGLFGLACESADVPSNMNMMYGENHSAARFERRTFTNETPVTLDFCGLQRGLRYRLLASVSNFAVNATHLNANLLTLNDSVDATLQLNLTTSDVAPNVNLEFRFTQAQDAALENNLLFAVQEEAKGRGNWVAVSASGVTVPGYSENVNKCTKDAVTKLFTAPAAPASPVASTTTTAAASTTTPAASTTTLRFLQDAAATTAVTTDTPVLVTAAPTTYVKEIFIVLQQSNTSEVLPPTTAKADIIARFDTVKKIADSTSLVVPGEIQVVEAVDTPFTTTDFTLKNAAWDLTKLTFTFTPVTALTDTTCSWKLNMATTEAAYTTLSDASISDCQAQASTVTTSTCGSVTFSATETAVTANLGSAISTPASYGVDFLCKSKVPRSTNAIRFHSILVTRSPPVVTPSTSVSTTETAVTSTTSESSSVTSASFISNTLVILSFVMMVLFN